MAAKTGMLPVAGNLSAGLLDSFAPEFIEDMVRWLGEQGGEEPKVLFEALGGSKEFRHVIEAGLEAARKADLGEGLGKGKGTRMLVVLCLLAGWKLAEHRMEQLAGQKVT
jgi:hypothetical protein